ncbi:hypothetical protein Tco_1110574 [Tanacetum coccineum]|uniref:Uncharacterized protein n=1 Tax=Tanacetum coccineum TaxID=301880 RepID=A0ABQ5IJ62_9ASTR
MIQVKEMMQDNDLKNSKSKDKGSRSRSQSMNDQSHYKQDKTKTRQSINVKSHIFNVIGSTEDYKGTVEKIWRRAQQDVKETKGLMIRMFQLKKKLTKKKKKRASKYRNGKERSKRLGRVGNAESMEQIRPEEVYDRVVWGCWGGVPWQAGVRMMKLSVAGVMLETVDYNRREKGLSVGKPPHNKWSSVHHA